MGEGPIQREPSRQPAGLAPPNGAAVGPVLLIDNYDSFVHTVARYVRELGSEAVVRRNDAVTLDEILAIGPSHIVVSPGPGEPRDAGISVAAIRTFGPRIPLLGICLGHQCIAAAYGGTVLRSPRPVHGKASLVHHHRRGIFASLPTPFRAARYHSLIVTPFGLPPELEVVATTGAGEVMALRHRRHPLWGVQFHPESVLTEHGHQLLANFLSLASPASSGLSRPGVGMPV